MIKSKYPHVDIHLSQGGCGTKAVTSNRLIGTVSQSYSAFKILSPGIQLSSNCGIKGKVNKPRSGVEQSQCKPAKILVNHSRSGCHAPASLPITLAVDCLTNVLPASPSEHLLQDTWTFWYLRLEKNFSWEHSQIDLSTFSTVEAFWGIFDNVLPLTEAHHGCNYSIFKKGIRPIWEDPMNRHGGRFVFTINKEERNFKECADRMWLEFALALIGNMMPDLCDQICGVVGGNRNNLIKIALWTRDCNKLEDIAKIGKWT